MAYEDQSLITPREEATPAPAATTPEAKSKSALPDELLQIPALQAVFAGAPPAVSASIEEFSKRPEAKLIADNKEPLLKSGISLYRSLDGGMGVLFNQFYIHGEDIKAADQAGRLAEIAPPFDSVSAQIGQSGENHPALQNRQPPAGLASPSIQTPPQSASAPPPSSAAQQKIANNRAKNIPLGQPTSGPRPGAGRLLNSILKPVV